MTPALRLRPSVIVAKEKLAADRQKLRRQHDAGTPGVQLCAQLTDMFDAIVLDIVESAIAEIPGGGDELLKHIAIVPHGGYGRRDVAPFSDVDLMILHGPAHRDPAIELTKRMQQDLFDAGLVLGHSLRTPQQALTTALADPTVFTSLAENRFLAGSVGLFRAFADPLRSQARKNFRSLFYAIQTARKEERSQYGEIVHLLEPNIKRSSGGLRGVQMIRWLGFARYGEVELDALNRLGALSDNDRRILRDAREFLLQLRNELHFHAGKSTDLLDRAEQIRIAELRGYEGTEGMLPVEQFMQCYFAHTSGVQEVARHFSESIRPRSTVAKMLTPLITRRIDQDWSVGPYQISTSRRWKENRAGDLAEVLRLMDCANRYDRWIDHPTWQVIRQRMLHTEVIELNDETRQRFLSLMSEPGRLGPLLGRLHELRVLEKIVPGMTHARSLLQFNQYHKYTVDAHCIETVHQATTFTERDDTLGAVYRGLRNKWILHLALLIHDLGKGFAEDHSEVGARYAEQLADRLRLSPRDKGTLRYLVHQHLTMSHLAFRRDTTDPQVLVRFAVDVGSAEVLKLLYVLTCADFAGVGPGTLNHWKVRVLTDLYRRAVAHLGGDESAGVAEVRFRKKERMLRWIEAQEEATWYRRIFESLPPSYFSETPLKRIQEELTWLSEMGDQAAIVSCRYLGDRDATEITIGTREATMQGVFHRLTGAVTSERMQILSAEINTLADGLVLDRYFVQDHDYAGPPPAERLEEIAQRIRTKLMDPNDAPPAFRKVWASRGSRIADEVLTIPTEVKIDNATSERYTIIDIFTQDQLGLLYRIARAIYEMGLSVHAARITTHLDQVVDVFYVTDEQGDKIEDEETLEKIQTDLRTAIEAGS
ncbi:MAG: [protein-PII] uridylyltransferase [Pirellulaceae bacterium]